MRDKTQERRDRGHELTQRIQRMLKQRNQLLQLLLEISQQGAARSPAEFEAFLQILVDYIAAADFSALEADLSDLGEALSTRMEFEDQLIELLLG